MSTTRLTEMVHHLQSQVEGIVLGPGDPAYDQERRGWNLTIDQRPGLLLVASTVQDVITGVQFAREHNVGVGVQSTGHGIHYPADGQLLIVTSRMTAIQMNPVSQTVRVEAGVIWQQVLDAAAPLGLAPLLGTSPRLGVVGYTLGGGIGWFARRYGLAVDSVRSIDIVTADGLLRHCSSTANPDLFWALRGGGGSFGVVTGMELALYPVASVFGGSLSYSGEHVVEAFRFFQEWSEALPDELTSSIALVKLPPLPHVPEAMRGKLQVVVRGALAGSASEGQRLLQPWLTWRTPDNNTFRELPLSEIGTIQNDPVAPMPSASSSVALDRLSDDAIDVVVRAMSGAASPLLYSELRHVGGAVARASEDAGAVGNRSARFHLMMGALTPTPEARTMVEAVMEAYKADLSPHVRSGVYPNFVSGFLAASELQHRTRDAFSKQAFEQLVRLKARYDPENLFRFSYPLASR